MADTYDNSGRTSNSPECYTPKWVVDAAREVMGGIDCDPASCAQANETIQAATYYTEETNGLEQEWHGRVLLNPPGERRGKLVRLFWNKLVYEVYHGRVTEFVWVAFNISQLRTTQKAKHPMESDAIVLRMLEASRIFVPAVRLRFDGIYGDNNDNPTRDNALIYWGPNDKKFCSTFASHGALLGRLPVGSSIR